MQNCLKDRSFEITTESSVWSDGVWIQEKTATASQAGLIFKCFNLPNELYKTNLVIWLGLASGISLLLYPSSQCRSETKFTLSECSPVRSYSNRSLLRSMGVDHISFVWDRTVKTPKGFSLFQPWGGGGSSRSTWELSSHVTRRFLWISLFPLSTFLSEILPWPQARKAAGIQSCRYFHARDQSFHTAGGPLCYSNRAPIAHYD